MTRRQEIKREIKELTNAVHRQAEDIEQTQMRYGLSGLVIGGGLMVGSLLTGSAHGLAASALSLSGAGIAAGGGALGDMITQKASDKLNTDKIRLAKLNDVMDLGPTPGLLPRPQKQSLNLS